MKTQWSDFKTSIVAQVPGFNAKKVPATVKGTYHLPTIPGHSVSKIFPNLRMDLKDYKSVIDRRISKEKKSGSWRRDNLFYVRKLSNATKAKDEEALKKLEKE